VGHVARMKEMRNAYKVLVKPEPKRSIRRHRRRWKEKRKGKGKVVPVL
jgi:hypothetical protein